MNLYRASVTRRSFLKRTAGSFVLARSAPNLVCAATVLAVHQAMGTRVGEITESSAIVWTRLTLSATRHQSGEDITVRARDFAGKPLPQPVGPVDQLRGACPGAVGRVRLCYSTREDLRGAQTTEWVDVSEATDFIHQFQLGGLQPAATYYYISETTGTGGTLASGRFSGKFQTAPLATAVADLRFCVMTCQGYGDRGHPDGHAIYPAMIALKPQFTCLTGDLVYYDNDLPRATTPRLARYHWERMFSLPRLLEFNRNVGTYWLKDDHDTLYDDSWPGRSMGELTFAEGQRIFRQQAPLADDGLSYRTFRWGRDLQIWLTDSRDFRSPNKQLDGPEKTIWGKEQKEWFQRTVKESTATWKILISPTPLVGPDRGAKNDNHANEGFRHEGDELRAWFKAHVPDKFFVICGDRHWQYHSVHPETGLNEFSVGAASDEHASGSPGEDKRYHRFHLVKGGFLSVTLKRAETRSTILCEHRDISGAVVYSWKSERAVA